MKLWTFLHRNALGVVLHDDGCRVRAGCGEITIGAHADAGAP